MSVTGLQDYAVYGRASRLRDIDFYISHPARKLVNNFCEANHVSAPRGG